MSKVNGSFTNRGDSKTMINIKIRVYKNLEMTIKDRRFTKYGFKSCLSLHMTLMKLLRELYGISDLKGKEITVSFSLKPFANSHEVIINTYSLDNYCLGYIDNLSVWLPCGAFHQQIFKRKINKYYVSFKIKE